MSLNGGNDVKIIMPCVKLPSDQTRVLKHGVFWCGILVNLRKIIFRMVSPCKGNVISCDIPTILDGEIHDMSISMPQVPLDLLQHPPARTK